MSLLRGILLAVSGGTGVTANSTLHSVAFGPPPGTQGLKGATLVHRGTCADASATVQTMVIADPVTALVARRIVLTATPSSNWNIVGTAGAIHRAGRCPSPHAYLRSLKLPSGQVAP